jgi:anti-anti-sigma regulatory factor
MVEKPDIRSSQRNIERKGCTMTIRSIDSASSTAFRYGNPGLDCAGAQMRAHCRQLATVVTISGDIDAMNVGRITQNAKRFVLAEKPFVLDLSDVSTFTAQSVSLLYAIDEACYVEGVEWSLIASPAVADAVAITDEHDEFPIAGSVPDALHHFAFENSERRRLLPILTKTA